MILCAKWICTEKIPWKGEVMTKFQIGEIVAVPCEIGSGAFSEEKFITLESAQEIITGFLNDKLLYNIEGNRGYVYGVVQEIKDGMINVWIDGSFFNTSGLTKFYIDWASNYIKQR